MFNPALVSTPATSYNMSQFQQPMSPVQQSMFGSPNTTMDMGSQFTYSAKHNGLYLYLCRILRPIWNSCCVEKISTESHKEYVSTYS